METLDLTKKYSEKSLEAGSVLVLQGSGEKAISILHSGLAEILYNESPTVDSAPEVILSGSFRVGLIKGKSPFGIMGIMNRKMSSVISIRCVTECIITSKPMEAEELLSKIQSDLPFNIMVLRTLLTRIESTFYLFNNYKYLWHKFASISDSIALALECKMDRAAQKYSRSSSTLPEYGGYLKSLTSSAGFPQPEYWDYNLFLGTLQDKLGLYAEKDEVKIENLMDYQQFLFLKRLIRKSDSILEVLFQKDEPMNQYLFDFLGNVLEKMMKTNMGLASIINQLISVLYGSDGWVYSVFTDFDPEMQKVRDFLHFLGKFSWRCKKDTQNLLGISLINEFPLFKRLKKYKDMTISTLEEDTSRIETDESQKRLSKYNGLLNKILDFSDLPETFKSEFAFLIETFRNEKNKLGTGEEIVQLRKKISINYWQLYEECFLKIIDSDLKGFIPSIMLHFGLVDETLVSQEELLLIDEFYSGNLYSDDSVPVMTLPYFLDKIYRSELNPSLTNMGDGFQSLLKKQDKMTERQKKNRYIYENTAEDRVRYEIRKISVDLSGILSGNKSVSVPVLFSETFDGNMKRFFIDPESLVLKIEKIRNRDFSLFYREVLHRHDFGSDFIQKEVLPHFILYPGIGSRAIMWQELDGSRKDSEGRFFFPLFFRDNLFDVLLYQLASFRWELHKAIAGHNWTDAVEGGVVGAYYDYIQFFKKNNQITSEAKKRLEEFIQKTKSDKDRFARDYSSWIQYEFEGKIRLNGAVREIFYRYCPFSSKIRAGLANKPLFSQLERRFQNRRQKEIVKLKSRILKFEKKNQPVLPELIDYMMFLEK